MTTDVPLRPRFGPGDYLCRIEFPDSSEPVIGRFRLKEGDDACVVNLNGPVPIDRHVNADGSWEAGFPQRRQYATLRGVLMTGPRLGRGPSVLFQDVEAVFIGADGGHLAAKMVLIGRDESQDDPVYRRVEFQVTGMDAVSGVAPLRVIESPVPNENARHLEARWAAEGNPDSTLEWTSSDAIMTFSYSGTATVSDAYNHAVSFSPMLSIELKEPIPPKEWIDSWVEPVRRIITLSTGLIEKVTHISFMSADDERSLLPVMRPSNVQYFGPIVAKSPFASRRSDVFLRRPAFLASDISLLEMAKGWNQLSREHHPMLETFGSYLSEPEIHPRSRLLLLVQALEGLHGYTFKETLEPRVAAHKVRRTEVLAAIRSVMSGEDAAFVKDFLAKRPLSNLTVVLKWALQEIPGDLEGELSSIPVLERIRASEEHVKDAMDAVRVIRNDLSHGNRGYAIDDIAAVVSLLERAAEAHMMRLLGCSVVSQEKAVRGRG